MLETVLAWRPFDDFTVHCCNHGLPLDFIVTYRLQPTPAGTQLTSLWQFKLKLPLPAALAGPLGRAVLKAFGMDREILGLGRLIAAESVTASAYLTAAA